MQVMLYKGILKCHTDDDGSLADAARVLLQHTEKVARAAGEITPTTCVPNLREIPLAVTAYMET